MQHGGVAENARFILSDPSHPQFCPLVSGTTRELSASPGVCHLLEEVADDFTLEGCRRDYCQTGIEGYENFIVKSVEALKQNSRYIAGCGFLLLTLITVQLSNLYLLIKNLRVDPDAVRTFEGVMKKGPPTQQ